MNIKATSLAKLKNKTVGKIGTKSRKKFDSNLTSEMSYESMKPARKKAVESNLKKLEEIYKPTESIRISKVIIDKIRIHKRGTGVSIRSFVELAVMSKLPKRIGEKQVNKMIDLALGVTEVKKKKGKLITVIRKRTVR